jgi:hypothetical protein
LLGIPAAPGAAGWALLALGAVAFVVALVFLRQRIAHAPRPAGAATVALALTVAAAPYVAWRFVEDLRVTTKLDTYGATAAGPIQAYLPGYLVDGAQRRIPPGATFATAVSAAVPWQPARAAFPSLALQTLFPRASVADARSADYVVTWGIAPALVAPVSNTWVVRPRAGEYPAVYVGRVRR